MKMKFKTRLSRSEREAIYKSIMEMWHAEKDTEEMQAALNMTEKKFENLWKDLKKLLRQRMVDLFLQKKTQEEVMGEMELSNNQFWQIWADCSYRNELETYAVPIMPEDAKHLPFDKWNMVKNQYMKYGGRIVTNGEVLKVFYYDDVEFTPLEVKSYRRHGS